MFRIAQTHAALALAVALTLILGSTTTLVAAQGEPTGTILPGMITIQGIVAEDTERAGSYDYLIDVTASFDVADAYRVADAGEQAYVVVDSATGNTIDADETDANGLAVLDGQVGAEFYVYEIDDLGNPLGTDDLFVPADSANPAISITSIFYVQGTPESVAPSVDPTVEPSTDPLSSGAATGTILPNAISVQGLVVEDPVRAGETDYLLNITAAAEAGDFRAAAEGEQTYEVVDLVSNQVLDSGTTDANGQVVLDGQVDASYYVVEVGDTGSIPGSDSLFYPAGDPNAFVVLTGVVYVGQLDPVASPSPSPSIIDSPSPEPSLDPVSSPSGATVPSDIPGTSDDETPSAPGPASALPSGSAANPDDDADGTGSDDDMVPGDDTTPDSGADGDRTAGPSAAGSRDAAPVISERDDISVLPNTGAGPGTPGPSSAGLATLFVALLGISVAGIVFGRRTV